MKNLPIHHLSDPRTIRLLIAVATLLLFILSAAAPGGPGDVGISRVVMSGW
jgi:hypothetical protein